MDWRSKLNEMVTGLERERDELRVRLHLAKAEGRDEWEKIDRKLSELRFRAQAAGDEAREVADTVGDHARRMADEIKEGLDRIRKTL